MYIRITISGLGLSLVNCDVWSSMLCESPVGSVYLSDAIHLFLLLGYIYRFRWLGCFCSVRVVLGVHCWFVSVLLE